MGGIIIVIIIVIVFVLKSVQPKSGNSQRDAGRDENPGSSQTAGTYRSGSSQTVGTYRSGGSYTAGNSKRHSGTYSAGNDKRYNGTDSNKCRGGAYSNGNDTRSDSVSGVSSKETIKDIRMAAGIDEDDGAILSAAKINSYVTEMDNELDSREDLLKPVYDLMVTGPDTSVPSGRDFVSEATDMLNSFTTKGN